MTASKEIESAVLAAVALKTRRLVDITLGYLDPGKLVVDDEWKGSNT